MAMLSMLDRGVHGTGSWRFVSRFSEIANTDVASVGGKNASLGEMYRTLNGQGIRVPNGFALTADAYRQTLDEADAWQHLEATLAGLDINDIGDLAHRAAKAREIVYAAKLPASIVAETQAALKELGKEYGPELSLAVRSSATAENLPKPASPDNTKAS